MKNKMKLFIGIFFIIQFVFSIKSIADEPSINPTEIPEQIALREVANA